MLTHSFHSAGGIIGPGLLVGSGSALAQAGPAGSLLAFALVGLIVFFVMQVSTPLSYSERARPLTRFANQSLGELSTYAPVSGSFTLFAARYIDPAMSFALGWQYYWLFCTVMANEYNSFSLLLHYWPAARVVPEGAYIALAWFAILGFAFLGIRWYGELEYWLSLIKCLAIGLFFIVAIIINAGGIGGEYLGFRYWGTPGAFADGINGVAKVSRANTERTAFRRVSALLSSPEPLMLTFRATCLDLCRRWYSFRRL